NSQIGRPDDAGHFQTGVNVWGSSSGAFPAANVVLMHNDLHVGQRGVSTQVYRDGTFQQNRIWIYGHAGSSTHIGFVVNTPVGATSISGNEILQMRSIRTDAT